MAISNHAFVRILINDKSLHQPVGAGFLVAPRLVLSCAHVILEALNLSMSVQDKPSQTVFLDFPFVDTQPLITAQILAWHPLLDNPHIGDIEDLALLELSKEIPAIVPLSLVVLPNHFNHSVRLTGFPRGRDEGIYLDGILKDLTGEGRVQIDTEQGRGDVAGGFSGSAVYDSQENAVVGIVVSVDTYGNNVRAYMIPAVTIIKAFPQLKKACHLTSLYLTQYQVLKISIAILSLVILSSFGLYYYTMNLPIAVEFREKKYLKKLGKMPYLSCMQKSDFHPFKDDNGKSIAPITTEANNNMAIISVLYLPKQEAIFDFLPESWGKYYITYINIGEKSGFYPQKVDGMFRADTEVGKDGVQPNTIEESSLLMILVTRHKPLNLIELESNFKRHFSNGFTLGSVEIYLSEQAAGTLPFYYQTKLMKHECYE